VPGALRAAAKPSPDRGYSRRTPKLEAPDNACFWAYSPECVKGLFSEVRKRNPLGCACLSLLRGRNLF
jgi:hypothetical protein